MQLVILIEIVRLGSTLVQLGVTESVKLDDMSPGLDFMRENGGVRLTLRLLDINEGNTLLIFDHGIEDSGLCWVIEFIFDTD